MNIRERIFGRTGEQLSPLVSNKNPKGAKGNALHSVVVPRAESRRSDSRVGDRFRLLDEAVRATHAGSSHDVQLINICGSGAMISAGFAPLPWDRVDLHLGDHPPIECVVHWVKDRRIGLEFAEHVRLDCATQGQAALLRDLITRHFPDARFQAAAEPQEQAPQTAGDEHRLERRNPLIRLSTLHHDYASTPARVRNVSTTGAMIESSATLRAGAEPLVDFGEAGSTFATVVWADGGRAGLRFKQAFDPALLFKSPPRAEQTKWEAPAYLRNNAHCDSRWEAEWKNRSLNELNEGLEGFLKR